MEKVNKWHRQKEIRVNEGVTQCYRHTLVIMVGHKKLLTSSIIEDEKWRKNETGEFKSSSFLPDFFSYMNKSISLSSLQKNSTWSLKPQKRQTFWGFGTNKKENIGQM